MIITKWTTDGLTYTEACRQPYDNCYFAAGFVSGHPVDTMYLQIWGEDKNERVYLLRPDEVAAMIYVLSGALYSLHIGPSHRDAKEAKEKDDGNPAV